MDEKSKNMNPFLHWIFYAPSRHNIRLLGLHDFFAKRIFIVEWSVLTCHSDTSCWHALFHVHSSLHLALLTTPPLSQRTLWFIGSITARSVKFFGSEIHSSQEVKILFRTFSRSDCTSGKQTPMLTIAIFVSGDTGEKGSIANCSRRNVKSAPFARHISVVGRLKFPQDKARYAENVKNETYYDWNIIHHISKLIQKYTLLIIS